MSNNPMIGRKIDVIAYTDEKGNIKPIRLRVENEDGSRTVIKIKNAMIKSTRTFGQNKTIRYVCWSVIDNKLVQYEITYDIITMKWLLYAKSFMC